MTGKKKSGSAAKRPSSKNIAGGRKNAQPSSRKAAVRKKLVRPATAKAAKPAVSGGGAPVTAEENLILSYKSLDDPSPGQVESARQLIQKQKSAKILRERPGMLQIAVPSVEKEQTRRELETLHEWSVSDEGRASIKKK